MISISESKEIIARPNIDIAEMTSVVELGIWLKTKKSVKIDIPSIFTIRTIDSSFNFIFPRLRKLEFMFWKTVEHINKQNG